MNWFNNHRQEWIAETLRVFGFIQRQHLMRKFGISMPQASADLKAFIQSNPDAIVYDPHNKRYVSANRRLG